VITRVISTSSELPKAFATNYVWIANNLSKETKELPIKDFKLLSTICYEFIEYFHQSGIQDESTLIDIVQALAQLSSTSDGEALKWVSGINFAQDGVLIAVMCDLLSNKNEAIHKEALRYMGGILNSEEERIFTKSMFNGLLDKVINIMYSPNHNLVKESLWTLSNLTASGPNYCRDFVKSSAMHRALNLAKSHNIDIQEEALWVLCNAVTCGTDVNARDAFLVESNEEQGEIVNVMLKGLRVKNSKLVTNILQSLNMLLKTD